MPKSKSLIDAEGEVRELTTADMKRFRPAKEVLSGKLIATLKVRGPQKTPTKERITIRLSPEVVQPFVPPVKAGKPSRRSAQGLVESHKPAKV